MNAPASLVPPPVARPLAIPLAVQPGEGLADLISRAAAMNCYPNTGWVVQAAAISGYCPVGSAASWAIGHEAAIATTLGLPGGIDDVRRLLHAPVEGRKGWHDFFGANIRLVHRSAQRRRVSPRALCKSLHSRAVWSIKAFSFDPSTKELLLDKCPECGRDLGYYRTVGISYCEFCLATDEEGFTCGRVDLRDYPQPIVSVADLEALDFVTGLIDPDPDVRARFRLALPECFQEFDRGSLFEFVLALGCVITADPGWRSELLPRPKGDADYERFTPEVLAKAGRIVLDWPAGFHLLAESLREHADERPGHYGLVKELGPLVGLTFDSFIEPGLRKLARAAIDSNMAATATEVSGIRRKDNLHREDLITLQQAAARYRVTRKFMARVAKDPSVSVQRIDGLRKSPQLMPVAVLDEIFSQRAELLTLTSVGKALHIPTPALGSIAEAGLLSWEKDPLCLAPGSYIERGSFEMLIAGLEARIRNEVAPEKAIPLTHAAYLLGSPGNNPWVSLVTSIIDGRLPIWNRNTVGLASRILVPTVEEVQDVIQPVEWLRRHESLSLTNLDVMLLLGCNAANNSVVLIRNGALPRAPSLRHVQAFDEKYMLTHEVGRKLAAERVCSNLRAAATALVSEGIHPVFRLTHRTLSLLLWDRAQVQLYFRERFGQ